MMHLRYRTAMALWIAAWVALVPVHSVAEVIRDGSLGSGPLHLAGPDFLIPQIYGETHGANLFHSFEAFSLANDQSATFQGNPAIQRILSRITGPRESFIDGLLRATIPGADLYLINPHGVIFGPNARLDLPGSLHVGSADYLRLGSSDQFHADLGQTSTLTTAAPEAFGFLGAPMAGVEVNGSIMSVPLGESLSLIGRDVAVKGGPSGLITAPGGSINLVGVASAGEVGINPQDPTAPPDIASFTILGDIRLSDFALLNVAPGGGLASGQIYARGQDFTASNGSLLLADNGFGFFNKINIGAPVGGEVGGLIDLEMQGTATIAGRSTSFDTQAASGGFIRIQAENIIVDDSTLFTTIHEWGWGWRNRSIGYRGFVHYQRCIPVHR